MSRSKSKNKTKKSSTDGLINGIPIRKIYVAPIKPQMTKSIKRYFQSFGEVESIRMHTQGHSQFGFVQYKSSETAKVVLSKSTHRVANCTLTVKPAYEKHQPDYKVFKPPNQDSPQHILNALNDDCLEKVFKQFKLIDLSVAADVCVRFQTHAVDAFVSKYKHTVGFENGSEFKGHPEKFEVMLRNFGSLIHSLSVDGSLFKTIKAIELLKTINKYTPALKDLKLCHFEVSGDVENIRPLFAKLESLSLVCCIFTSGAEKSLATCSELKRLYMSDVDWDRWCIDQTFPKLEEAKLTGCSTIDDAEFKKFITSNPTLKKLSIDGNSELESVSIIQLIGQRLKNLEELQIDQEDFEPKNQFQKCTQSLNRLKSLKKLALNLNEFSATSMLKKLAEKAVPLESLSLKEGSIDSTAIKSMAALKKLNKIELDDIKNLTDDHIIVLAKELPELREIHLNGMTAENLTTLGLRNMLEHAKTLSHLILKRASNIRIDVYDYRCMLKSVQERSQKTKLLIEISGTGDKVNVPEKDLSDNRDWLWIDEEIEDDDDTDDDDDFVPGIAFIALHALLNRFNQTDSDESDEDEEMNESNSDMNFDLD